MNNEQHASSLSILHHLHPLQQNQAVPSGKKQQPFQWLGSVLPRHAVILRLLVCAIQSKTELKRNQLTSGQLLSNDRRGVGLVNN